MRLQLKDVRIAFPKLFELDKYNKYSATFLLPKGSDNENMILDAMKNAAKEKFGDKAAAIYKKIEAADALPLKDGDGQELDGFAGHSALRAGNKLTVKVIDRTKAPLNERSGKPYGGCYVNAVVEVYAMEFEKKPQINCTLCGVQFVRDGDAFSGGRPASDDEFESYEDSNDGFSDESGDSW